MADACQYLFPRNARRIKWGLGVTESLLAELGHPEREWRAIHVAGTNGKGSVSCMVAQMLREMGWRVGLYTSPHLVHVGERIAVNGASITDAAFVMWTNRLKSAIEATDASFFEALTAIAFADFAARGADICVVEVGLGGRLDCTNVISPLVSVVTRVGLEHEDYLGSDLMGIAREKAGIAKRHVPFLTAEPEAGIRRALLEEAERLGACVRDLDLPAMRTRARAVLGDAWELLVPFRQHNAACAIATAENLPPSFRPKLQAIRRGIELGIPPGRFERRGRWLLDSAHNPQGMRALVEAIRVAKPARPLHAVVGVAADKRWREMIEILASDVDAMWLTSPPAIPEERRLDPWAVEWPAGRSGSTVPDFEEALRAAERGAGTVLITGSLFTVGAAIARLPAFSPLH